MKLTAYQCPNCGLVIQVDDDSLPNHESYPSFVCSCKTTVWTRLGEVEVAIKTEDRS
ncbi:MAG TPA: hypothetical protein VGS09_03280 [Actinomycetota bacterium]|nr:hypothetical protein [Actinomycetota bacterium]